MLENIELFSKDQAQFELVGENDKIDFLPKPRWLPAMRRPWPLIHALLHMQLEERTGAGWLILDVQRGWLRSGNNGSEAEDWGLMREESLVRLPSLS